MLSVAGLGLAIVCGPAGHLRVQNLEGRLVHPLQGLSGKATVFVFIASDCPLANAYSPELARIYEAFHANGIRFESVYEDGDISPQTARAHAHDYAYRFSGLIDSRHELAASLEATVTPEAVVVDSSGKVLYRGRIDNTYASLSRRRGVTSVKDLRAALDAICKGLPIQEKETQAIGCAIPPKNWKLNG
jgi:hypothetical protein